MDENFGVNVDFQGDKDFGVNVDFQGDKDFGVDIDDYSPAIYDRFYKEDYSLKNYAKCAMWCNENHATIVDKGDYYECIAIPPAPLEEVKANKIQELKSARDAEELSPIEYNGFMWDFDDKAQMRINGAITVLGDNSITWTSADNQEVNGVTVEHLKAIVMQASIRSNAVHVKYRQLKALVEEAETAEEVEAIEW